MKLPATVGRSTLEPASTGTAACETVILRGRVTQGRGKGTAFVERHADRIRDAFGESVVKGSLNILLQRPVMLRDDTAIKTRFDDLLRLDWPGRLNGTDVWLHRWDSAPLHIVELLCTVHLRTHLNLSDGDEVEIEARKRDIGTISNLARVAWVLLWFGRRNWCYTNDRYGKPAQRWSEKYGATQLGTDKRFPDFTMALVKMVIKKVPGVHWSWQRLRRDGGTQNPRTAYQFERVSLNRDGAASERPFGQIHNLLNYTKTSGSVYSAYGYPAGYHTLDINGRQFPGQRKPAERLKPVPVNFDGKTVLDIGCNQGGMLFELPAVKWAVGVDYDPHMINVANRIRSLKNLTNMDFYVLDLEHEPLDLIEDFMPEPKVDIVFLLAVCAWLTNWREVISWCAKISGAMLYETTGATEFQESQIAYLRALYGGEIVLLAERSEDDPGQKNRKLFYCGGSSVATIGSESSCISGDAGRSYTRQKVSQNEDTSARRCKRV